MRKWNKILVVLLALSIFISQCGAIAEAGDDMAESDPFMLITGSTRDNHHVEFYYRDSMLLADARGLSTDVAKASVCLAGAGYETSLVNAMLTDMGFDISGIYGNFQFTGRSLDDNDHVAYTIGHKVIGGRDCYCVVIRGTYGNEEWFSNMNLGENNNGRHEGFWKAADEVKSHLMNMVDQDSIIWITGHSRGAAVANIVAAYMTAYYGGEHVFGYTFACPNVSKNVESLSNIHNFNNDGDLIAVIPLKEWHSDDGKTYKRFGIDHISHYGSSGINDISVYVAVLLSIVPEEKDYYDAINHFGMMFFAYMMMDSTHSSTTFTQFLNKYVPETIERYIYDKVMQCVNILDMLNTLTGSKDDIDEAEVLLTEVANETSGYTENEFANYLIENKEKIDAIKRLSGVIVKSVGDIAPGLSTIIRCGNAALSLYRVVEIASRLVDSTTGNILTAIPRGHEIGTYLSGINHEYFGYRGYYGSSVTSISVPENITSLGPDAFRECGSLTDVVLPDSMLAIGKEAFYDCQNLVSIVIPAAQYIEPYAFSNCKSLTDIEIPDTLISIGERAFYNCSALETIVIPDSVTEIGSYSLVGLESLKDLTIPVEYVARRDLFVYYYFNVGYAHPIEIYEYTNNVEKLHITKGKTGVMSNSYSYNSTAESARAIVHLSRKTLKEVILDEGIQNIGDYTFYIPESESELTGEFELTIPSTVTTIGICALAGDHNWKDERIVIPDSVTEIGGNCFQNSDAKEIVLSSGLTEIPTYAFYGCEALQNIDIPDTLLTIGNYAFYGCISLKDIWYKGTEEQWQSIVKGTNWNIGTPSDLVIHFNSCIIVFNANGGSGEMDKMHLEKGETFVLPENAFEYLGYHFMVWQDAEENIYQDQETIESVENDMILSAIWEIDRQFVILDTYDQSDKMNHSGGRISYIVSSLLEETSFEELEETCDSLKELATEGISELQLSAYPDEGYMFVGWFEGIVTEDNQKLLPGYVLISSEPEYGVIMEGHETEYSVCAVFAQIRSIVLPDAMIEIGEEAFEGISATVVHLPANCVSIGDRAFKDSSVCRIIVPSDCELGEDVFEGCRLVYLISQEGSTAQQYCENHENCRFVIAEY